MKKKVKGLTAGIFICSLFMQMPGMVVFAQAQTLGEKMKNAGFNTVLGMGTVFVMLIVMALIIYAFRLIPMIQEKFSKAEEVKTEQAETSRREVSPVQAEETDDLELVAVIAAAIAAYEQVPADSFKVRTIKRRQ